MNNKENQEDEQKEESNLMIAKKSKTIRKWDKYKKLKTDLQKEFRKAYEDYILNIICSEYHQNTKKFFRFIKGNGCENSGLSPLKREGVTHSDP